MKNLDANDKLNNGAYIWTKISQAKLTYAAILVLSAAGLCRTVTFEGCPIEIESQDCLVFWHQHPKNVI